MRPLSHTPAPLPALLAFALAFTLTPAAHAAVTAAPNNLQPPSQPQPPAPPPPLSLTTNSNPSALTRFTLPLTANATTASSTQTVRFRKAGDFLLVAFPTRDTLFTLVEPGRARHTTDLNALTLPTGNEGDDATNRKDGSGQRLSPEELEAAAYARFASLLFTTTDNTGNTEDRTTLSRRHARTDDLLDGSTNQETAEDALDAAASSYSAIPTPSTTTLALLLAASATRRIRRLPR